MSHVVLLGVILSDEVAVATEESKNPFGASNLKLIAGSSGHIVISRSYRGPSASHPPDPEKKRVGSLCGRSAQDDKFSFMNNPAEAQLYPCKTGYIHCGTALSHSNGTAPE